MDIQAEYDIIDTVRREAKRILDSAKGSHAWDHTLRVYRLCERIGAKEGADLTVLRIAAYLHDIGRSGQDAANGALCHAHLGAKMAEPIVGRLPLSEDRKMNITHCVRTHRFRGKDKPETLRHACCSMRTNWTPSGLWVWRGPIFLPARWAQTAQSGQQRGRHPAVHPGGYGISGVHCQTVGNSRPDDYAHGADGWPIPGMHLW